MGNLEKVQKVRGDSYCGMSEFELGAKYGLNNGQVKAILYSCKSDNAIANALPIIHDGMQMDDIKRACDICA